MDLFSEVLREFDDLPHVKSWPEAAKLFHTAASRKPDHWLIPARGCESVGGSKEQAIPGILAIGYAHVGILLVDDMLDADPRGDYHQLGMPAASNLACFFQAAALQALSGLTRDERIQVAALHRESL